VWLKGLGIVQSFESCGLRYPDSCDAMIVDMIPTSTRVLVSVSSTLAVGSRLGCGAVCR